MQNIDVSIKGLSPLLVDKPVDEQLSKPLGRKGNIVELAVEESLYRNGHGCYAPFNWIDRTIKGASKSFKEPGKRGATYYKSISGAFVVEPEEIIIEPQKWEVFSRSLRLKNGNRIIKTSPMFPEWSMNFQIILMDWFAPMVMESILEEAGRVVGIGAWTPRCGGRFGKFEIVKWKVK